jgi:hypothetical protein
MNNYIANVDGFKNWAYYTNADSLIKNSFLEKIKNTTIKYPDLNKEISLFGLYII